MKKLLLAALLWTIPALAQFTPKPVANYYNPGTGWTPMTSTATFGALPLGSSPAAVGNYDFNTSTGQWVPHATNGGGGGAGTVTSVSVGNTNLFTSSVATPTTTPNITFTCCNTGAFANPGTVNAVTRGLNFEYHFQEASGATTITDYSGAGNNGTVTGTVGLTGTLVGGMNACPTGCVGSVAPSGYVSATAAVNGDATIQVYTCTNSLTAAGITGGFTDMIVGGLISATPPSGGTTQAVGMMIQGGQGNNLATNATSVAKYAIAPGIFNNTTVAAQSIESVGGCHLITWVRNTAPTPDILYIDGHVSAAYQFTGTGTLGQALTAPFAFGTAPYVTLSTNYKHPYPIYYAAGSSVAWTAEEVQRSYGSVLSSMGFRGVVQLPPVYSDAGNQLVTGIDSLTFGYGSSLTRGWPSYLSSNPKPGTVTVPNGAYPVITNLGIVGLELEQAIAECQSGRWQTAINPNSPTTFLFWGATNDVANQNATAASGLPSVIPSTAYQRLRRLVQCAKGLNPQPRVVVATMISRGINGVAGNGIGANAGVPMETLKANVNDLVRKDYAGADGMFDIASIPAVGADGASLVTTGTSCIGTSNTPYFANDSVHLTDCGQQTIASYWAAYLNYFDNRFGYTNPPLLAAATYTETSADVAIAAAPTVAQTITLPTAVGLVGTSRYVNNTQSAFPVTIAAATGENIDGAASIVCASNTKCVFASVLGPTPGVSNADVTGGAHWEQVVTGAGLGSNTFTGSQLLTQNSTATTSNILDTGTTATAAGNNPHWLWQPTGTTGSTWLANGTVLGLNAPTGFTGRFIDTRVNGGSTIFSVAAAGAFVTNQLTIGLNSNPAATALAINGTANTLLPGLVSIVDSTTATGNNFGFTHFAPTLPTGGSLIRLVGKTQNTAGESFMEIWNETAAPATNNLCMTIWGLGTNCNLKYFLDGHVNTDYVISSTISALASATTIAPVTMMVNVSGTTTITTITPPPGFSSTQGGCITLFTTGILQFTGLGSTTNSISSPTIAATTAGTAYQACFNGTTWSVK